MKKRQDVFIRLKRMLPKKSYILLFTGGFLFASLCFFYSEDRYEQEIFTALHNHVKTELSPAYANNKDSILIHSLHLTHYLGERRLSIFGDEQFSTLKSSIIQPLTFDLQTAKGACGSYSYILSRLLKDMNISTRIAQMKSGGQYGAHMVVEAKTAHGWVVLDPIFNQYFTRPNGSLAGFADVQANWPRYSQQVSKEYDLNYKYEGVRYTNWDKVPVIMPAIKQLLYWTIGKERTDGISIRNIFLRKYHMLFNVALVLLLLILFSALRTYIVRTGRLVTFYPDPFPGNERSSSLPA